LFLLFLTDQGSPHNRGCAADISLIDLKTNQVVYVGAGFDEMTERAYPYYLAITSKQRALRDVLRRALEAEEFTCYKYEWWHFDYKDQPHYPMTNKLLSEL
jgi:D-alanyl-D-alanine dipeptidase